MALSDADIPKKRGRRPSGGRNAGVLVRLPPELLAAVDGVIREAPKRLTRPQAIRDLVEAGLTATGKLPSGAARDDAGGESASVAQRLLDVAKQATAIVTRKLPGSEG